MKSEFINSIDQIDASTWRSLAGDSSPFVNYNFYKALENSQSVCLEKGWQPHHLVCANSDGIQAIMPMYIKQHSWGEYVFDWAWADAYQQHNQPYYPKLVATAPFTPISSDKLLSGSAQSNEPQSGKLESATVQNDKGENKAANTLTTSDVFSLLTEHCLAQNLNSWHVLYTQPVNKEALSVHNIFERLTVQFHWFNQGYQNFDDFLSAFTARKRKNVKKERLSIANQDIKIRRVLGKNITPEELEFFYLTYQLTYLKRGHSPHLTLDFFERILTSTPDNILLVIASIEGEDIACAWFFFDEQQLYGRYWGCTQTHNNLHFELCYYQGIEFCIEQKLQVFNSGAQGEHKIQRGFEPVLTYSYHWIKHQGFRPAIKQFCLDEQQQMQNYLEHCQTFLPFKAND